MEADERDEATMSFRDELLAEMSEPARAVFPLAAYLVFFTAYAQWQAGLPQVPVFKAEMLLGIPAVVLGLSLFKRGLRLGLMPLGEQLGSKLPLRMSESGVSAVCFVLAIGLTFAEPAIGALQEAAVLLDARSHPLLARLFMDRTCLFLLVLVIGVGVGVAAVTGSLRLLYGWGIKPMIYWTLVPCLAGTVLCGSASTDLASLVGLAWDSGAVTTGPVTVPVVISLGIGLARAARTRGGVKADSAREVELSSAGFGVDGPDEGCYGLMKQEGGGDAEERLIMGAEDAGGQGNELEGFGIVTFASLWPVLGVLFLGSSVRFSGLPAPGAVLDGADGAAAVAAAGAGPPSNSSSSSSSSSSSAASGAPDAHVVGVPELSLALQSLVPLVVGLVAIQRCLIREPIPKVREVASGILCVFVGLVMFNAGLNFGLLPLGDAAGGRMAASFVALNGQGRSEVALAVVMCFAFVGTFAAQVAEPALNVLGETVERLTNGAFRRRLLVYVVALGVATGTCMGVLKTLWDLSMWKLVLPMYALAVALTRFAPEGITCVAWDAGGVTTGSVTVPLILALGLGLGKEMGTGRADGFGLLGCASVFPIVTVLLTGIVLDPRRRLRPDFGAWLEIRLGKRRPPTIEEAPALG